MFATLSGALPRPTRTGAREGTDDRPAPDTDVPEDELVRVAIDTQESAGLDLITDGRLRAGDPFAADTAWSSGRAAIDSIVAGWEFATRAATRPVKQSLPGPYSIAGRAGGGLRVRRRVALACAESLNAAVAALAGAGCPLVEIEEAGAAAIGDDERERTLFRDAHRRVLEGIDAPHVSLALVGASVDAVGPRAIFDAPYASYLFDLVAGPDNWRLVRHAPAERGIVCGALPATAGRDEPPEILAWAAHYAASAGSRGLDRVGLANAAGLQTIPWTAAVRKLRRLGEAARLAALPADRTSHADVDPRARLLPRARRASKRS
jgi:methionine synthase II (cobalamin-independent)